MDRALGPAVDEGSKRSAALIRRRDDDVGVARIEDDVADTGVLGDLQHLVPGLAAVGRLVEATVAAGRPERSLCGDIHRIAILRIDDDAPDMFGGFQADVGPRSATVLALVDTVAVGDRPLRIPLAGANPDDARTLRIDGDPSDRERTLCVAHRLKRRAAVHRFPDAP